jgi:hypothetical protein
VAITKLTGNSFGTDVNLTNVAVANSFVHGTDSYQMNRYVCHGQTTNGTEAEIYLINSANSRIPVTANSTLFFEASIVACSNGESASWHLKGCADNHSGNTADVGDIYEIAVAADDLNWSVDMRADDTNDTINVYVTGVNSKTVNWTAVVNTIEVIP